MSPFRTSSFDVGVVVPIPTLVSAVAALIPLMLPRTIELLCSALARCPIAVALVRLSSTSAPKPTTVRLLPFVFESPAPVPKNELPDPVVFDRPALRPKKEFEIPDEFSPPADEPKNELALPVVFWPTDRPKNELLLALPAAVPAESP